MKGVHLHWLSHLSEGEAFPAEEKLHRALIAGLILEAILEAQVLPEDPPSRRVQVKNRLQHLLVSYLAGLISLDSFRHLAQRLDHWFNFYYPLLSPLRLTTSGLLRKTAPLVPLPGRGVPAGGRVLKEDLLEVWLEKLKGLLPQRRHGKLHRQGLGEFLRQTRGGWFKVKDFEEHFAINGKTAWEYVQKFRQAGLLTRNQGRSAAARYSLHPRFLRVKAEDLRQEIAVLLADLSLSLPSQVADWLIFTGGENFWEEEWPGPGPEARRREIIRRLTAGQVLEIIGQTAGNRLLRLSPGWVISGDL